MLELEDHNAHLEGRLKGQEEVVAKLAACVEQVSVPGSFLERKDGDSFPGCTHASICVERVLLRIP